jgi:hypothetical protein
MSHSISPARSLYIEGSRAPRPKAARVIYCDGGVDGLYRNGIDLELSHWIPNTTPPEFKASTSTEICMKYVQGTATTSDDLVINNHVDVDGVLSTFVLLYPQVSLRHRDAIVQAAEMGDFASWGNPRAQELCQALLCSIVSLREQKTDPLTIYRQCYEIVHAVLAGERFATSRAGIDTLQAALEGVENGSIRRQPIAPRFVHYAIPKDVAENRLDDALYAPRFDMALSSSALLPPNVRAKFDREKIHLVSVESDVGTYFDLWYPGYCWAETVGLWLAPGIHSTGSSNLHELNFQPLTQAVTELNSAELKIDHGRGKWELASSLSPFEALRGRNFPIVLAFMSNGKSAPSRLPTDFVVKSLANVFAALA